MQKLLKIYREYRDGFEVAFAIVFYFLLSALTRENNYSYIISIIYVALYVTAVFLRHKKLKKDLKERGLTPGDLTNIEFVKNWQQNRKAGIIRYCLLNGGFITGIVLFIPLSFIIFFVSGLDFILASFKNLLFACSTSLAISYLAGAVIYYVRWKINERRFIRLTNPLQYSQL